MRSSEKISILRDELVVDREGYTTSIKKVKTVVGNSDFIMIYAYFWEVLLEANLQRADRELLYYLLNNYADGTIFSINDGVKQYLANRYGRSKTSYNSTTKKLVDGKLIFRVSTRTYKLNPQIAFTGNKNSRKSAILEMDEYCPGCFINKDNDKV